MRQHYTVYSIYDVLIIRIAHCHHNYDEGLVVWSLTANIRSCKSSSTVPYAVTLTKPADDNRKVTASGQLTVRCCVNTTGAQVVKFFLFVFVCFVFFKLKLVVNVRKEHCRNVYQRFPKQMNQSVSSCFVCGKLFV